MLTIRGILTAADRTIVHQAVVPHGTPGDDPAYHEYDSISICVTFSGCKLDSNSSIFQDRRIDGTAPFKRGNIH